ncbi:hypothetical protein SBA1_550022 [Candidatus Sulfotelmatobacter kueseliae]|uniref:YiaAB two helix domain-containing protein n=1 Tax=Candidatus Sulfotelmatobacter kueseliae TaxID=2042962 RepID=A0A2U3KYI2_9BACT|nr:hypothetical protein SBA1_550022 [Candidatus Sulfotelmatobacter kueseliae]
MLLLLKQEIDRLVEGYSSPSLGLFSLFFGAFLSLLITDFTGGLVEPVKMYFVLTTILMGCLSLAFAVFARRDWRNARKVIEDLEDEKGVDVDVAVRATSNTTERPCAPS